MRSELTGFRFRTFLEFLGRDLGKEITSLVFHPAGEDSYGYIAQDSHGQKYYVKLRRRGRRKPCEQSLRAAFTLRHSCGLDFVLAPPERDLVFFTGPDFEAVIKAYLRTAKHEFPLSARRFAYYLYRWDLGEIADNASRILFEDLSESDRNNAWAELQQYLPLRTDALDRQTAHMREILYAYERT